MGDQRALNVHGEQDLRPTAGQEGARPPHQYHCTACLPSHHSLPCFCRREHTHAPSSLSDGCLSPCLRTCGRSPASQPAILDSIGIFVQRRARRCAARGEPRSACRTRAIRACDPCSRVGAMRVRDYCQVTCSCTCRDLALSVPCTASQACLGLSLSHDKSTVTHVKSIFELTTYQRSAPASRLESAPVDPAS